MALSSRDRELLDFLVTAGEGLRRCAQETLELEPDDASTSRLSGSLGIVQAIADLLARSGTVDLTRVRDSRDAWQHAWRSGHSSERLREAQP